MGDYFDYIEDKYAFMDGVGGECRCVNISPPHSNNGMFASNVNYDIWSTQNGKSIPVRDMTDDHLHNSIRMLKRNMDSYKFLQKCDASGYIKSMESELERRRKNMPKIANVTLKVVGVSFDNSDGRNRQNIIKDMTTNSAVFLNREPQNQYDINAIAVMTIDGQIGYISKDYSSILAPMMDKGTKFEAKVNEVNEYKNTHYVSITINEL